jgi:hypothetical protein
VAIFTLEATLEIGAANPVVAGDLVSGFYESIGKSRLALNFGVWRVAVIEKFRVVA